MYIVGIVILALLGLLVFGALICWLVMGIVEHKKTKKPYRCCLGYHKPSDEVGFDGCSSTATCKRCGCKLLQDSQGNWFECH